LVVENLSNQLQEAENKIQYSRSAISGRVHESWINSEKRVLLPWLRKVYRVFTDYVF